MQMQEIVELFLPKGTDNLANTIGPQGNLIDKLQTFNTKYMLPSEINPLKVTKKWRWAPGTYDRVKEAYTRKILQWHRRPRTMASLFNKRRVWYENDIKRELDDIETCLIHARRDNSVWLDEKSDNGILEQVTYEFTNKIEQLYSIANSQYDSFEARAANHDDVQYYITSNHDRNLDIVDDQYILIIKMPERPIEVTKENVVIGNIPFPALTLTIKIDVARWISHSMAPQNIGEYTRNGDFQRFFNLAVYYEVPSKWYTGREDDNRMLGGQNWPIYHPFIQSSGYHENRTRPWNWRNICWGSYGNEIINSFMSMDWNAFFLYIEKWLYQYEMVDANPLNNIRQSFLGVGSDTSTEMLDVVGFDGAACADRLSNMFCDEDDDRDISKVLNYCDVVRDCSMRHEGDTQCLGYKRNVIKYDHEGLVDSLIGDEVEERLLHAEAVEIYQWTKNSFNLRDSAGRSNYRLNGVAQVYKRLFGEGEHSDLYIEYRHKFTGSYLGMSAVDQTILAYIIMNKYWEAYVEIISFTFLLQHNRHLEDESWDTDYANQNKIVASSLKGLLTRMTDRKVAKKVTKLVQTDAQTEADRTRIEMLEWANEVSNGRIASNPFGERLEASMASEDTEDSEPSI